MSFLPSLLVLCAKCVRDVNVLLFIVPPHRDVTKLRSVPEMGFYGLQMLCLPKHGDQKEVRANNHRMWWANNPQTCWIIHLTAL